MKFYEIVDQVIALLHSRQRLSYRALSVEFDLTEDALAALKEELIEIQELAADKDGKMLVWLGTDSTGEKAKREKGEKEVGSAQWIVGRPQPLIPSTQSPAERRQLTVLFCDLVGSTALSTQLDPEDLRAVVRQYQQICAEVIHRHDGHIAQYLGDGLLVYFGYPTAHEDDAHRAVRTGLEIVGALREAPLQNGLSLQVRLGIHTGLVVIGEMGASGRTEQLALGETPNIAARLQGLAEPNTVLISAATQRLVGGQFESQPFGSHLLKGIATPIAVYHVQGERQSAALATGHATALIGREQEVGLLLDRWEQAKEGRGQVVLLSGEPGIGKSRLAATLKEQVTSEGSLLFESRCSPYHQHSALYPLIEGIQWTLLLTRHDTDAANVEKVERALALYGMQDRLPLFTALLSLPTPATYPPLTLMPQQQKERTFQALLQLLAAQAERQATVSVWEDLHWADPSSLEFLSLLIEQLPTTKLLLVLTFRPEFVPPWKPRSHVSQLVLNRLGKKHVETMIMQAAGQQLAPDVIEQIRLKTDGVPLFVEELTKSVVESVGAIHESPLQLGIPATLHDALMARLDRLGAAKEIAQLGATLGREFSYELLQALARVSETELSDAVAKLVEAEILYQRGVKEQARYFFKHALIQDTAYESLLKSTRQHYHRQIAQVLEDRFPDTRTTQPEVFAHHYTEAGLTEQAIPYWQAAGQGAIAQSANAEAIRYLTTGLTLLATLPETPERIQLELGLQTLLGVPFMATKGWAVPEVKQAFSRALDLSQHLEETPQIFPALFGMTIYYGNRSEYRTGLVLAERCLRLANLAQDSGLRLLAEATLGSFLAQMGELVQAHEYCEQRLAQYDPARHGSLSFRFGLDPGIVFGVYSALTAWFLGYPDHALRQAQDTWRLAQSLAHPPSRAIGAVILPWVHGLRREPVLAQERIEPILAFATATEQVMTIAIGTMFKGAALTEQGYPEDGLAVLQQGGSALQAIGTRIFSSVFLLMLAHAYELLGEAEKGLATIAEAEAFIAETGERWYEAELYRLKGELLLLKARQPATENGQ